MDRRSDVYSLGATMYEICCGQLPFDGESSIDVIRKILDEEPVAPRKRNSAVTSDLETIILKCMEKEPERRYETAKMLAEDLRRHMEGEPILAAKAGVTYKIVKKIRKHPFSSSFIGVSILAVLLSILVALQTRWQSQMKAQLLQEFGQQIKEMEGIMRYAYLLPLHDVRHEKEIVRARLRDIERRMKLIGSIAYGPGYYAMGQSYLIFHDYYQAHQNLSESWNRYRYRVPEVATALGMALALQYQKELQAAEQIGDKKLRDLRVRKLEKEHRMPALDYLRIGAATPSFSSEYVEALISFLEKDYDAAEKKAEMAYQKFPWLYEAMLLIGDTHVARANEHRDRGQREKALRSYEAAREAYTRATAKGTSDVRIYEALCGLEANVMQLQVHQTEVSFRRGLQACENGAQADPDNAAIPARRAMLYFWYRQSHR